MNTGYRGVRGFTLIELMVAMLIVGVLMAIAIPSYQKSVQKGHRSQAEQLMQSIASKEMEFMQDARFYSKIVGPGSGSITTNGNSDTGLQLTSAANSYNTSGSNAFNCAQDSSTCTNAFYTLTLSVPEPQTTPYSFSITAIATGQQLGDGDLSLDSLGNKSRKISGVDQGW